MDRWKFVNEKWIPRPVSRGEGFDTEIPLPHPTSAPSGHLLPMEGGSVHTSPFLWKGLTSAARRGWLPFWGGEADSSLPSPLGKGDRAAVDRVLSYIVDLRRSFPLFFMPLEPYPARSARHLPHAGRLCVGDTASPSNLRPFGAPPSYGRREYSR